MIMLKRTRQFLGIFIAIITYYLVHEGAHLLYALHIGVFKQINFMKLGVQVDVFAEQMTDTQLGIFFCRCFCDILCGIFPNSI